MSEIKDFLWIRENFNHGDIFISTNMVGMHGTIAKKIVNNFDDFVIESIMKEIPEKVWQVVFINKPKAIEFINEIAKIKKDNAEFKALNENLIAEIKNILSKADDYNSMGDISTWVHSDLFNGIKNMIDSEVQA